MTADRIVREDVERYVEEHTSPPAARLAALAEETRATTSVPQMMTGTVEGRFLEMLVWAAAPRLVLDVGTFTGYSALSMAPALPEGGRIVTCEIDPEHAAVARRHIGESPWADRIDVREGPALETIDALDGPFDLVFIDADKTGYAGYVEAVIPKLSERGLVAIDNTLWSGRVAAPAPDPDERTRALVELNDRLVEDERLVVVMLTVRDGVTLVRRRTELDEPPE